MMPIKQAALFVCLTATLTAQVSMQVNLPRKVAVQSEQAFEVKIQKGNINNFSKFQLSVPEGITITELDSKGGSFSFDNQHAKIIWAITPSESEITVRLGLTASAKGTFSLNQKFYYLENEGKKEIEVDPYIFNVVDASEAQETTGDFVALKQHVPEGMPAATPRKPVNPDDPNELKMHALQLKKDSREANKVGETELKKAEENLEDANSILKLADQLEDNSQKQKVVKHASAARDRAQVDIQVANKILALAAALEKDADDIQKLNAGKPEGDQITQGSTQNAGSGKGSTGSQTDNSTAGSGESEQGVVFRLQLGAFGKEPARSGFKNLGKVAILNEDGLYKVLLGSFSSKEAALKKRGEVLAMGYDAFVVSYRDGVRIR
jgi:hypothetical protein